VAYVKTEDVAYVKQLAYFLLVQSQPGDFRGKNDLVRVSFDGWGDAMETPSVCSMKRMYHT